MLKKLEKNLKEIIVLILGKIGLKISASQIDTLMQIVKFGLVGILNTGVSYIVFVILTYLGAQYLIANVTGFVVSVLNSFYWNEKYVFVTREPRSVKERSYTLFKTFLAYGSTGIILNSVLLVVWIDYFHVSLYLAPLINLLITIPINFLINKLWAFNTKGNSNSI